MIDGAVIMMPTRVWGELFRFVRHVKNPNMKSFAGCDLGDAVGETARAVVLNIRVIFDGEGAINGGGYGHKALKKRSIVVVVVRLRFTCYFAMW